MKVQRSIVLCIMVTVVALITGTSIPASQHASAHDKAHTASSKVSTTVAHAASKGKISVHQVVVDPQAHGIPLLNATALKKEIAKEVKGPYGEKDVIGGMMSGGY